MTEAKIVAIAALQQYDIEYQAVEFIQISDHITYKIITKHGDCFLLRIHPENSSKNEIQSELLWLESLTKTNTLTVPSAVLNRNNSYITEITTKPGKLTRITIMNWVQGEHKTEDLSTADLNKMGILMARLHNTTYTFVPPTDFFRSTWDEQSFIRNMLRLEQHYGSFLSEDEFKLYQLAAEKILTQITQLPRSVNNFGLIHADLHVGNLVFNNEEPYAIDFGRCGYGFYLYDLALALIGLHSAQRQLFIEGYQNIRQVENDYIVKLECFFIMACIENYCFHASNPLETDNLKAQQPYAQALIRSFLQNAPFLFNQIEL